MFSLFRPARGNWQISIAGGLRPRWRSDGKEIFYIAPDQKLMAVPIKLGSAVESGTPQPLFAMPRPSPILQQQGFNYAPSKDGQRFLVNAPADTKDAAPPQSLLLQTGKRI